MLQAAFYFILAIFILVTIHEAGHFLVARFCGVKVLRFSFGFGRVLFSKMDKRGTSFAFSLVPLGGYVKLLNESEGEVPKKERHLAFNRKPLKVRVAIILAGPLANFVLAFFAFWCVAVLGMKTLAPIVDEVTPLSVAAKAGFMPQDEMVAINGKPVVSWRDVRYALMPYMGATGTLKVQVISKTDATRRDLTVPLGAWTQPDGDILEQLGLKAYLPKIEPRVSEVLPNTPAAQTGLMTGDEVLTVDDKPIQDWRELVIYVKKHPGHVIHLTLKREEETKAVTVKLDAVTQHGKTEGRLGVLALPQQVTKRLIRTQREAPFVALKTAAQQTWHFSEATLVWMGRMLTGHLPVKHLTGPLGMAEGAGYSAQGGLVYYLSFLAFVSIGLGVLNLLPIPMLDGGQLLYALIEWVTGRPLSERSQSMGVLLGLIVLMALTAVALRNDLIRLLGS